MANFLKTIGLGYKMIWEDINVKLGFKGPRIMSGVGTLMQVVAGPLFARKALKKDVQEAIESANKALAEVEESVKNEKASKKIVEKAKAQTVRACKVAKEFAGPIAMTVGGAVLQQGAMGWSTNIGEKAIAGAAAIGAEFAAYRAAVRAEEGEEADLKYLTGGKPVKETVEVDENGEPVEYIQDENGFKIVKDPGAFKLWYSKETCPTCWYDTYDLRQRQLENVQNNLDLRLRTAGHISLNDMRREFNTLFPAKMDVGIGGIYGVVWTEEKFRAGYKVNLHFKDDKDFMEGRTDSCWIIFDCDPEPIVGKIGKKFTSVEV